MRRMICVLCAVVAAACARDDSSLEARDVTESGEASDVIGRPEGADSIPPEMRDRDSAPPPDSPPPRTGDSGAAQGDSAYKRPERRPVREVPPLTRPDSGKP